MSDFEINKLVAEMLALIVLSVKPYCLEDKDSDGNSVFQIHGSGNTVQVLISDEGWIKSYLYMDYCNNPSDAWPIILEIWDFLFQVVDGTYGLGLTRWKSIINQYDCDELRAAMIVYLMMGEE